MLVIPVEKKGKYSHSLSLRFLCYDPSTRMAYLSDKDAKIRRWKHRMKVYAIMPAFVQGSEPINFRLWNFEAKELLNFIISGVSYHRLDSNNIADQIELQRLPQLLNESYQESAPSIRTFTECEEVRQPSQEPVNLTDDLSFFGRDRDDWSLRCPYYNAAHDTIMLMRDTLIEAGLRFPIYGGLLGGVDPRNGLHLANFPLYLQQNFRQLTGAIVYSCVHGRMIGCTRHGHVGVCMRHVYLCVTDQDVLFVAENGSVARSVPLSFLNKVEYNGPTPSSSSKQPFLHPSSAHPSPAGNNPSVPYIVFLANGEAADVFFSPCSAFPAESDDCSASMAASMPRMNVSAEIGTLLHILTTLLGENDKDAPNTKPPSSAVAAVVRAYKKEDRVDLDADVALDGSADSVELGAPGVPAPASLAVPHTLRSTGDAPANPAPLPSDFSVEALNSEESMQDYVDAFQKRHHRDFKWQPLLSERHLTPTVQSAASVAQSLGMRPPPRQAITRRSEFLPFYYGSAAVARAAQEMAAIVREERQARASNENSRTGNSDGGNDFYGEEVFATTVPVRKVSKLINMFKPEQDIY